MIDHVDRPDPLERSLIAAAGLDATFATFPAEVLAALRNTRGLRDRLQRPEDPSIEPATVFRPPVEAAS